MNNQEWLIIILLLIYFIKQKKKVETYYSASALQELNNHLELTIKFSGFVSDIYARLNTLDIVNIITHEGSTTSKGPSYKKANLFVSDDILTLNIKLSELITITPYNFFGDNNSFDAQFNFQDNSGEQITHKLNISFSIPGNLNVVGEIQQDALSPPIEEIFDEDFIIDEVALNTPVSIDISVGVSLSRSIYNYTGGEFIKSSKQIELSYTEIPSEFMLEDGSDDPPRVNIVNFLDGYGYLIITSSGNYVTNTGVSLVYVQTMNISTLALIKLDGDEGGPPPDSTGADILYYAQSGEGYRIYFNEGDSSINRVNIKTYKISDGEPDNSVTQFTYEEFNNMIIENASVSYTIETTVDDNMIFVANNDQLRAKDSVQNKLFKQDRITSSGYINFTNETIRLVEVYN